jgi:hypothetical protein
MFQLGPIIVQRSNNAPTEPGPDREILTPRRLFHTMAQTLPHAPSTSTSMLRSAPSLNCEQLAKSPKRSSRKPLQYGTALQSIRARIHRRVIHGTSSIRHDSTEKTLTLTDRVANRRCQPAHSTLYNALSGTPRTGSDALTLTQPAGGRAQASGERLTRCRPCPAPLPVGTRPDRYLLSLPD